MKIKLCIFDLDGTLLDTIDDIGNSMNHALIESGFPPRSITEHKNNVGFGARKLLDSALPLGHGLSEERCAEIVGLFKERYRAHSMDMTKPYEGIPELLRFLGGAGIKLAVVSNKPHKITVDLMEEFFGDVDFVAIYGEQSCWPMKPDPYLAHEILSLSGVLPEQALVIGDGEPDMIFAENASIFSIGVLWGFRSREILEASGAKAFVDKPEQIKDYL